MMARSLTRLGSAVAVTGIATLALATPAAADYDQTPAGGTDRLSDSSGTTTTGSGWELSQVLTGAAGGLALAGIGYAGSMVVRRRGQVARPA